MAYKMLDDKRIKQKKYLDNTLESAAISFIREHCEGLRFDSTKAISRDDAQMDFSGTSLKKDQIPFNMEKDIDRLCLENSVDYFLKSGKKEDAFNVYFCYLEMFVGDYNKTRRMIELLSEFEANGSGLLMKHRDHYSHSVYVFILGLAIFESNSVFRESYKKHYCIEDEHEAAAHYLKYWGLTSLFHDIGYPFELPFEQVCSYFEVGGDSRNERPFVSYNELERFVSINGNISEKLSKVFNGKEISDTNELFAYILAEKLGSVYNFTESQMLEVLHNKPTHPDKFNHFMDHAYFSATVLFNKLFCEMGLEIDMAYLDALTAILMHNSLYKFSIANYKGVGNKPFKSELHPLAYMLMLCDELQCWDRVAYGRNSKRELHPMGCTFDFSNNGVKAVYQYDAREVAKINLFKDEYIEYLQDTKNGKNKKAPKLKAYSEMYIKNNEKSGFQEDIERIVDLQGIEFSVETGLRERDENTRNRYISDSKFINLYNFAIVLHGRWKNEIWKNAKANGQEEKLLNDDSIMKEFTDDFKGISLEYKLSNINQAKGFARYLNEIGCFYTDKSVDYELIEKFSDDELVHIGVLEHQRWLQEHYDMGWTYGTLDKGKREQERRHEDMIPDFTGFEVTEEIAKKNYARLDKATQDLDKEPMECMLSMLKLFDGLRIYRFYDR